MQVADYMGSEIVGGAALGLNPNTRYPLLRSAAELQAAAPTFEGKPVMTQHRGQTADDHDPDAVCGAMSNVRFEAPFLVADLAIWTDEAIELIESGAQKQLSCSYYYTANMTPGTFQGEQYAGIMEDLRGNHCARVALGRAGAECMVGDAALGSGHSFYQAQERDSSMYSREIVREVQAIRAAEIEVEPAVGAVMGMDSAAGVYAEGLRRLGMDRSLIAQLHGNAAQAVYRAARSIGYKPRPMAMDSAELARRDAQFPNWKRLAGY